jgi:hypothetical protein
MFSSLLEVKVRGPSVSPLIEYGKSPLNNFFIYFAQLISTYSNDKLLRGQFSFSGKDSNGAPW